MTRTLRLALALAAALTLLLTLTAGPAAAGTKPAGEFWLTILHNNDGESQLLNAGAGLEDFGGVARFKTLVDNLKSDATTGPPSPQQQGIKRGVVMLSSGDNFLAGPEFNASLEKGVPFFDTIAMDLIGYDAAAIGNHEFDFGPDVLADFIRGFETDVPFLSANLDFSDEPALQALVDDGRIAASTVVKERGEQIGIIGATTPMLRFISSPRNVGIDSDVPGAINDEVEALEAKGVNKIILISHLQSIEEDLALAPMLSGVDVMIAGGGDELLANPGDLLVPGDEGIVFGPYPLIATDGEGKDVPVITTPGSYKYVGELGVAFDKQGNVVAMNSGPVRVSGVEPDAVEPDPVVQAEVTEPVEEALEALAQNVIATSEVDLDGRRAPGVRTMETNEGNLIADSFLYQATKLAASFGVEVPQVALQNGGGRFAQVGGFRFTWDAAGTAQTLDEGGNVVTPGTRVREVVLDDGTVVVSGGVVAPAAAPIDVATIDFLARGGDQYPFRGLAFTTLGLTYQQALEGYLEETDGLNGLITAAQYPEGGEGRITRLN